MEVTLEDAGGFQEYGLKMTDPKITGEPLKQLISRATLDTAAAARKGAPYDAGALKRSMMTDIQPTLGRVFSTLDYANAMEFGRSRGTTAPPPQALEGWLRRHGKSTSKGNQWALAQAISSRGVRGRFFLKAAVAKTQKALPKLLTHMGDEVGRRFSR